MTSASEDNIGEKCAMARSQVQVHSMSTSANSHLAWTVPPLLTTFLVQCSAELQYSHVYPSTAYGYDYTSDETQIRSPSVQPQEQSV